MLNSPLLPWEPFTGVWISKGMANAQSLQWLSRKCHTKHLLDTAHSVGKQSETKPVTTISSALSFLPESICGECAYTHICIHGHLGATVSSGTQAAAFARAEGMSMPGASPQSRGEMSESPCLGHSYPGTRVCLKQGQSCGEVSCSVNCGFCFLGFTGQQCPGPGLLREGKLMGNPPALSSEVDWHQIQTPPFLTTYYYGLNSISSYACEQSKIQQSSLKLLTKEIASVLHLGDVYLRIYGGPCSGTRSTGTDHPGHAGGFGGSSGTKQNKTHLSYLKEIDIRPTPKLLGVCLGLCSHASLANTVFSKRGVPLNQSCNNSNSRDLSSSLPEERLEGISHNPFHQDSEVRAKEGQSQSCHKPCHKSIRW